MNNKLNAGLRPSQHMDETKTKMSIVKCPVSSVTDYYGQTLRTPGAEIGRLPILRYLSRVLYLAG